jgi:hypothetical protein
MKFLPIIAALALPFGASAQSLHETHDVVWHPAGKTPAMTHRLKTKPACVATADHHRAGRGQMVPLTNCKTAARTTTAAAGPAN